MKKERNYKVYNSIKGNNNTPRLQYPENLDKKQRWEYLCELIQKEGEIADEKKGEC